MSLIVFATLFGHGIEHAGEPEAEYTLCGREGIPIVAKLAFDPARPAACKLCIAKARKGKG